MQPFTNLVDGLLPDLGFRIQERIDGHPRIQEPADRAFFFGLPSKITEDAIISTWDIGMNNQVHCCDRPLPVFFADVHTCRHIQRFRSMAVLFKDMRKCH